MYMPYIANSYQPLIRLIEKPICFYEDYQSCLEHEKAMMIEISEYLIQTKAKVEQNFFVQLKEVLYDSKLNIFTSLFRNALNDVKLDYHYPLETLNCFEYNNNIRSMLEDLKANINKRYLITHTDEKKLMFLQETFKANNIDYTLIDKVEHINQSGIYLAIIENAYGFEDLSNHFEIITPNEFAPGKIVKSSKYQKFGE